MGAPESGLEAAGQSTADTLLTAFRTIKDAERARHGSVLDYWLSIRGDKEFPPLRDLDALEISDAGPSSILFELIGGGQDAEIRHLGDALAGQVGVQRLIDAPSPSLLATIARKLPIVAISRDLLCFEDNFTTDAGLVRCWVTLLPLSSCGSWVDYVYAFISLETSSAGAAPASVSAPQPATETDAMAGDAAAGEPVRQEAADVDPDPASGADIDEQGSEAVAAGQTQADEPLAEVPPCEAADAEPAGDVETPQPIDEHGAGAEAAPTARLDGAGDPAEAGGEEAHGAGDAPAMAGPAAQQPDEPEAPAPPTVEELPADLPAEGADDTTPARSGPGFSRLIEGIANLAGFYGQGVRPDAEVRVDVPAIEPGGDGLPHSAGEEAASDTPVPPVAGDEEIQPAPDGTGDPPLAAEGAAPIDAAPDPIEPVEEPAAAIEAPAAEPQPAQAMEGSLQNKLSEVRAKADEAREAQRRATQALHEGLSAAYDFALDAEASPEEYLRMVEAQGMKIQLRSPMAPIARLAFDGVCDAQTIKQFEAALAWALKEELPRGALIERIEQAGGISELLKAA